MIFCTWLSDLNIMVCAVHILALLLAQQQAALYRASLTSVPQSVHILPAADTILLDSTGRKWESPSKAGRINLRWILWPVKYHSSTEIIIYFSLRYGIIPLVFCHSTHVCIQITLSILGTNDDVEVAVYWSISSFRSFPGREINISLIRVHKFPIATYEDGIWTFTSRYFTSHPIYLEQFYCHGIIRESVSVRVRA